MPSRLGRHRLVAAGRRRSGGRRPRPCARRWRAPGRRRPRRGAASWRCAGTRSGRSPGPPSAPTSCDVGHLRAADALVDPAHDVAEDALGVVVELGLDLLVGPARAAASGMREQVVERRPPVAGRRAPRPARPGGRRRRRGGSGWRAGSPRSATAPRRSWRPALGWATFCGEHVGHQVGRRPHALADLGPAAAARRPGRRRRSSPRTAGSSAGPACRSCGPSGRRASRCGSRRRCGRGSRC